MDFVEENFEGWEEYTPSQMQQVMDFIEENFGGDAEEGESYIAHEFISQYIHTDVVMTANDENKHFVTCGMGVKKMPNCKAFIDKPLDRIEVLFCAAKDKEFSLHEKGVLAGELCRVSKYPFEKNTFFGPGHTINASEAFKKAFGYDYFVFFLPLTELSVDGIGDVSFLPLIPIYEEEREWMVENDSFEWMRAAGERIYEALLVGEKREAIVPNK